MFNIKQKKLPINMKYIEPQIVLNPVQDLYEGFKSMSFSQVPDGLQSNNYVNNGAGWKLGQDKAIFHNIEVGGLILTITPSDDMQTALDDINASGGGTLHLSAGTYTIANNLTGYSAVKIEGTSTASSIIDFNSEAYSFTFAGTDVYTTGTITSISYGVNVVGSGTAWTSSMAGMTMFIGTRSYVISSVTDATNIVLAEGYSDDIVFPASYRISTQKTDIILQNLTIKNSTSTALVFTDARRVSLKNVLLSSNDIGISITNSTSVDLNTTVSILNTSDGLQATNLGLCDWSSINSASNGGNGITLNNVKDISIIPTSINGNTGDGMNFTTVSTAGILLNSSGNSGNGVNFVSDCNSMDFFSGTIQNNALDGVVLTDSTNNCHFFGLDVELNGGYGINIASGNSNNTITTNSFSSNTSGAINDLGTNTVIRGNTGLNDNSNGVDLTGYTVATLPTGVTGMRTYVTDATSPTYLGALTGGGTVTCPVFFDGTSWLSA